MRITLSGTFRKMQYVALTEEEALNCLNQQEQGIVRFKDLLQGAGVSDSRVQPLCFGYLVNREDVEKSVQLRVPYRLQLDTDTAKMNWQKVASTLTCGPQFLQPDSQVRQYELLDYLPLDSEYFLLGEFEQACEFQFECEGSGESETLSVFWEQYDLLLDGVSQPSLINVILTLKSNQDILLQGQYPAQNISLDEGAWQSVPKMYSYQSGVFCAVNSQDISASLR